ncbi:I78 family peptidase inhibitor [Cognatishimia activa]|uniref:I78 family peptidase inhibitor n=1 Tax=Cognatishimia activa TaxID=1715691 RepID=UPI00222E339C|nr:I78 family peptidase inhibitor [Cognatishimia activa]UZD91773.1 I78 family peptidase inhibitor [Cognatishimia activa]
MVRVVSISMLAVLAAACVPQEGYSGINDRDTAYTCDEIIKLDLMGMNAADIDPDLLPEKTRIVKPGMMVTMDHIPTRFNLIVDDDGAITRWYCG